jgi:adenine nucleotide transporter 17
MIRKIINEEGFSGFYKGIIPSLILTLNPVIQFTSYELMRNSFSNTKGEITNKNIILISFISKLITILINYPLMTIKSMYQANNKSSTKNTFDILRKMINEEGIFSLYKGISSKIVGSLISNTILMIIYEKIQKIVRMILINFIFKKKK